MSGDLKPWQKVGSKPVGNFRIFTIRSDEVISPRTQQTQDVYVIDCVNWVNVIALTPERNLVMIEQYRHGSNTIELEIPGGMMDPGDASPVAAGLRELREETGHEADNFKLLASLSPSVARYTNRMYCFFAADARPVINPTPEGEPVSLVFYDRGARALIDDKEFYSAPSCAALYLAALRGDLLM